MAEVQAAYPRGLDFEQVWAAIQATGEKIDRFAEENRKQIRETGRHLDRANAIVEEVARRQEKSDRFTEENRVQIRETGQLLDRIALRQEKTDRFTEESREQIRETERLIDRIAHRQEKIDQLIKATAEQAKITDKRVGELTGRFGEVVEYMIVPNLVAKFRELGFEFTRAGPDVKIADREHDIHAEVDAFLENGDKVMIVEIKSKPNTDDVQDHVEKMEKLRRYADLKGDSRKYLGAIAGVVVSESVANYALKNGFYVIEPSGDTFNIIEPKGKYRPREW